MSLKFYSEIADKNIHMHVHHINAIKHNNVYHIYIYIISHMQCMIADIYLEGYIWLRLETKTSQ